MGIFYKDGYFRQLIDRQGRQTEIYETGNPFDYPMKAVKDEKGADIKIQIELPNRPAYAKAWEVSVGRTRLFLLDTDIPDNIPHDREISLRLYGGDKKTRIKQEILLGIGGIRLLNKLGFEPALYHLNEGHCAFLLIERLRDLIKKGMPQSEAKEAVKASSVFTTHTPVPAGNEVFDDDLMKHYFSELPNELQTTWDSFINLGKDKSVEHMSQFSMTVLALRLTSKANGVSKQHGKISRSMWTGVWPELFIEDIPITSVTNGVHIPTWLGREMRKTFDKYLDSSPDKNDGNGRSPNIVKGISEKTIWHNHMTQKAALIDFIKKNITKQYIQWASNADELRKLVNNMSITTLTIGFAKRFASYKRPQLLFQDIERLKNIVRSQKYPVQIVFAGKAHPADNIGKDTIKNITSIVRSQEFWGKIIFIENYDIELAKLLVQGVDLWLNVPIPPNEASGTSGMKAGANGVVNLSTLDGWWYEGYQPEAGWAVDPGRHVEDQHKQDQFDNLSLMDALEHEIIPMYYDKNGEGIPARWVEKMKNSILLSFEHFSTRRMLKEYCDKIYVPAIERKNQLINDNFKGLRELNQWKQNIRLKFSELRILEMTASGIDGEVLHPDNVINFNLLLGTGKMKKHEIKVELIIGRAKKEQFIESPEIIPFKLDHDGGTTLRYQLSYKIEKSGNYSYGIRIIPTHPLLPYSQETGLIAWV